VMLWVASGQVRLDRTGTDPGRIKHPAQEPLDAGVVRLLDGNDTVEVESLSASPAEVWIVSTDAGHDSLAVSDDSSLKAATPPVVAFMPLRLSAALHGSPMQLSILQLTLPPGTSVPAHPPGVIEEIAVLDGALQVTVDGGAASLTAVEPPIPSRERKPSPWAKGSPSTQLPPSPTAPPVRTRLRSSSCASTRCHRSPPPFRSRRPSSRCLRNVPAC
jgi:hypothetical protein